MAECVNTNSALKGIDSRDGYLLSGPVLEVGISDRSPSSDGTSNVETKSSTIGLL